MLQALLKCLLSSLMLNVIENYIAGLLIASRQVLRECPVTLHLEHLNARFGCSSCWPRILRFFGLPGGRRVVGGKTSASLSPASESLELELLSDTVGGE